jgi:hypothetical protein
MPATKSFAAVMIIVHDLIRSPVSRSVHSSHSPAIVKGWKPRAQIADTALICGYNPHLTPCWKLRIVALWIE